MNLTSTDPVPPPLQPPQPHRSSFSCDRHPDEQFTGFCPSCLCERLTTLDQSNNINPSSSSRRNSTSSAAAAIKSLFTKPSANNKPTTNSTSTSSFFPELRRTKSFSASKNDAVGLHFEPQRRSCDVRSTLSSLFTLDDVSKINSVAAAGKPSSSSSQTLLHHHHHDPHYISKEIVNDSLVNRPGLLIEKEEVEETEAEEEEEKKEVGENCVGEKSQEREICVEEIVGIQQPRTSYCSEIVEEDVVNEEGVVKPMKDHIDNESHTKKTSSGGGGMKEIAGTFRSAASVFSKKWHKWRTKQKAKKRNNGENTGTLPVEKPLSRHYRETQSEVADYGFGRRSCDIDPRFSLDAGRISFDDARYSFEEARASWDGYLIGRSFPRMNPMVSLVEDAPVVHIPQSDSQIPVEEPRHSMDCGNNNGGGGDETAPGGSIQTREYYADSSSRRRKSLDRSSSVRKTAAAVMAEMDEMKTVSNVKVSPTNMDHLQGGTKVLMGEKGFRESNSSRDDISDTFELGSLRDDAAASVIGSAESKGGSKKSRRWNWNILAFINRRNGGSSSNKDEDDDRYSSRVNGVDRSFSGSWQELRDGYGDQRGGLNRRMFRSHSSVRWRNSTDFGGSFGNARNSSVEMNSHGKKRRDEFVLERNQSARYSPKSIGNGLLRLYLTPMGSGERAGPGKNRPPLYSSHSIATSVLQHV